MPILVRCPSCAGQLRVHDDLIGQQARCPACQTVFDAVAPGEADPAPVPAAAPSHPPAADVPVETVRIEPWRQLEQQLSPPRAESEPAPEAVPVPDEAPRPARRLVGAVEVDPG